MALFGRENQQDHDRAAAYARWMQSQNPFAVASLVLGVFSLIEFGVLGIFGVGGIVTGVMALRQIARPSSNEMRTCGRGIAWIGIIASIVSLILAAIIYLRVLD